jgi:cyclohexadienyl dehydratase
MKGFNTKLVIYMILKRSKAMFGKGTYRLKRVCYFTLLSLIAFFTMFTCHVLKATEQSPTLQAIQAHKVLRIGTTGDYPPLSFYNKSKRRYEGFDIDMGKKLADYLGVRVEYIPTTWKHMGRDLRVGRFDIAMSGITVTPEKESAFYFTTPILEDGIGILAPCQNKNKYKDLSNLNLYGIRIAVEQDSDNEAFAKKTIERARIIPVPDNTAIVEHLTDNLADVAMVDLLEGKYIQQQNKTLCLVKTNQLYSEIQKAYLINKTDKVFLQIINNWIAQMQASRAIDDIKSKWLESSYT